jgi:protein SCO1
MQHEMVGAPPAAARKWKFKASYLLYFVILSLAAAVLAFTIFQPIKVLPRVGLAPGFSLQAQDGRRVTSEDYRGKFTLYSFSYAGCTKDCPQTGKQMQALYQRLSETDAGTTNFALVTLTVDPVRDSPQALKAFAAQYPVAPSSHVSWDFLTGDPLRMKYVIGGGFGLYYENDPADTSGSSGYRVKFSPKLVLVDGWGIVRAEYGAANLDIERVMRDIDYLIQEVQNSTGPARYAYEAAHLFRCYP